MNATRSFALAASVGLIATGCGINPSSGTPVAMGNRPSLTAQAAPGEMLVKFRSGVSTMASMKTMSTLGLRSLDTKGSPLSKLGWQRMAFDGSRTNMASLIGALSTDPTIAYAEPNYVVKLAPMQTTKADTDPTTTYNDPMAAQQYTIEKIDLPHAHSINQGSTKTTLAIVDTGVDYTHPDFMTVDGKASRVVKGKNFSSSGGADEVRDGYGHGTHCAGIAAATANNKEGVVGVAPGVKILAVKVLGDNGSGSYAGVAGGIVYSADQGAKVISMSLGGPSSSKVLEDAVAYAISKDSLIIAAMGNDYDNVKSYPAAINGVMPVISTDNQDQKSDFSNWGDWSSVSAPGSDIMSTLPTYSNAIGKKNYGSLSGTSMATPATAGLAALVRDLHPEWDLKTVRAHIEQTSDDLGDKGYDPMFGHGRINAFKALKN